MLRHIPNLFTLLNLVFGCVAIIFILQSDDAMVYLEGDQLLLRLPENMMLGAICIYAAAVIDFLDGFIARWLKVSSEMGKQLDSLSDAVSFGVAPSLIMYQLLRLYYLQQSTAFDTSFFLLVPALIIACCAVWRLAKFNLDQRQSVSFRGVPTPITGLMFASLPMIIWFDAALAGSYILNAWFLYGVILLASYLMVSDLPMMSFKIAKGVNVKENLPQILLLLLSLILIIILKWTAVPLIYILYVTLSLLFRKNIIAIKS
jgi:CDP-diacylglycerol--serine O-phosphatidyltransferase